MAKITTKAGTVTLHPSLGTANAAAAVDVHAIAPVAAGRPNFVAVGNGLFVDISDVTGVAV